MKLNKYTFIKILSLCAIPLLFSSCSVAMAARKSGTNIETVQAARTRGQFLACGATVIGSERMPSGELVETYQYQKEKGSAARAFMHGVLDVSTCGLWEVVGTPIEACVNDEKYFTIRVFYDLYGNATKVELL